jgi:hypothetical protein
MKKEIAPNQKQPALLGIKLIQRKELKGGLTCKVKPANQNQEVKCPSLT